MTQMRFFLVLAALFFAVFSGFSQTFFQKSYAKTFFEHTMAVESLSNGHFIMAGFATPDASGQKKIWVFRVNADGDVVWSKTYATGQSCTATAIQKTMDGNLLITYNTMGSSVSAQTSGWMKISTDGNIIWAKKAIGLSILTNISPAANGGYFLCGQNITASTNQLTGLVVRIGEDGEIQWSTVFGENGSSAVTDCWEDPFGLVHCCGYTAVSGGNRNGFWAKLAADGELVGPVRRYGSSSDDELTRIVPMGTDRLLLSGYSRGFSNSDYSAVWMVAVDYAGTVKNSKTYALNEVNLSTNDMIALPGNQYLLALGGLTTQLAPAILMKLSVDLDQLFAYQYKGGSESDVFSQVIKTGGGFSAAGGTFVNGDENAYLVTTDVDGKLSSDDCCPYPLEIVRKDVTPETVTFVPTQTAFYSAQNATLSKEDFPLTTNELCQPIDLEFTLSVDTICPGECVDITAIGNTPGVVYSYDIYGGEANPDVEGQVCHKEGAALFITRKGANNNCVKSLTKRVSLGAKKDHFPNAFTPNGDAANDIFRPVFGCPAVSVHFEVYDRWGKKVFDSTNPVGGWDGKIDGADAPSDVYVWKLQYELEIDGQLVMMKENGEVTLLR